MFIKRKHKLVIIFSSLVVGVVFVSTLMGYNLYILWKEDSFALGYRNSIYKLTADLFRNDIAITNVSIGGGNNEIPSSVPFIKGSLKNNSVKTITSVLVEVFFQKQDGIVIHKDWIYPLGKKTGKHASPLFYGRGETQNVLLPGEGISFRHPLRNCSVEILEQFSDKTNFARINEKDRIKVIYSIVGLDVL